MVFLNISELNLPEDVIKNSGVGVELIGEITGAEDEIVVITQLGRFVSTAHVCHLLNGYTERNGGSPCKIILDMPGFNKIVVRKDFLIKEFNGIKYTMACLAEKDFVNTAANWLY